MLPNWQVAIPPNFQTRTLPPQNYNFHHALHGNLVITRVGKLANTNQINFNLQLTTPGGAIIHDACHLAVDNNDQNAHRPLQIGRHRLPMGGGVGTSSVGYGDIDISNVGGMNIIYLVHYVFALTGSELGVAMFVVESIVNPAMDHICQNCGMGWAVLPNVWQGACGTVEWQSQGRAFSHGWH